VLIPITMDIDPAGQVTHRTFRVENESNTPVAVQGSMVTRKLDIDGKETLENADEDFVVYPPQIALGPKQNQSIQAAWTGKVKPAAVSTITSETTVPRSQ
jgi:fimbrial chaperone protein